jgi:aconitate decarboxylase
MIIEELANHVLQSRFENFDNEVVEQAKNRVIDIVGCTIGGANAPGCPEIVDLVRYWGGREEATVLVHGFKAPAHNVAMLNSIMARSFDFGVLTPLIDGKEVIGHLSETTVPTAISVADWKHVSGKEFLTALILGDDISARILKASNFSPHSGWDSTGIVDMFGSTAISGKLIGLNTPQMINAFGIVVNQMAGTMQNIQDGVMAFKLPQGLAAQAGIFSAVLASKGWTGIIDPLLSKFGFFALYSQTYDTDILTHKLGEEFYADCTFKPYPCCRGVHAAIDCALNIVNEHDINVEDIDDVTLNVSTMLRDGSLGQPFNIGPFPQGNAGFNLRYNVANVLVRRSVKLEHFTEEFIRDSKVNELAKKVNVTAVLPPVQSKAYELKVRMKNGQELFAHVDISKGNAIKNPLTKNEIEAKYRANVNFSKTISKKNAEVLLDVLYNLEEIDDMSKIIGLMVVSERINF